MKKVITTFIFLCIICTPEPTFSQNSLQNLIKQFQDAEKQLNYIRQDLLKILIEFPVKGEECFLNNIIYVISSSEYIIANTIDLIVLFPTIKDEHKLKFGKFVQARFSSLKQSMESEIESIQIAYAGIKNRAALYLIDKAKDQMRTSLSLFDRSLEVLKLNKITKSKK